MTKRQASITLLAIAFFFLIGNVQARTQDTDTPQFNAAQVPAEGARAEDFVPRGWKIAERAEGDLNGDRRTDHALHLVPQDHDMSSITAAPESHALVILFAADAGRLRRAGLAIRLLVRIAPQYIFDLTIRNGVLVVHQNYGMTDVADLTHRFRYEAAAGRFILIGKDTFNYHRPQGARWPETRTSDNYLTGVRLVTTDRWLNDATNRPTTRREQIARTRVFLEDVDEDPDN